MHHGVTSFMPNCRPLSRGRVLDATYHATSRETPGAHSRAVACLVESLLGSDIGTSRTATEPPERHHCLANATYGPMPAAGDGRLGRLVPLESDYSPPSVSSSPPASLAHASSIGAQVAWHDRSVTQLHRGPSGVALQKQPPASHIGKHRWGPAARHAVPTPVNASMSQRSTEASSASTRPASEGDAFCPFPHPGMTGMTAKVSERPNAANTPDAVSSTEARRVSGLRRRCGRCSRSEGL